MQTGNQAISFEIKSQLAKLLATENITMRHSPNSRTAYFDVKSRELVLPVWQNISEDLYDMLVVHEVGHALDTPMDKWMDCINQIANKHYENPTDRNKSAVKGFLNVIEDARIDKRQKRRYPGSRRNYVNGYKELHERDFFGIAKRDINKMTFIDRINIFFKHGAMHNIKFSSEENVFIKRIENAETFDDVISITSDIFGYSLAKKDFDKNKKQETFDDIQIEVSEWDSSDNSEDMDEDDKSFFDSIEDSDDESGDNIVESSEDEDSDDYYEQSNIDVNNDNSDTKDIDAPETEQAAENSAKYIVLNSNVRYVYLDTPELNHDMIIDDYPVVIDEMLKEFNYIENQIDSKNQIETLFTEFLRYRQNEQQTISYMVKEFDMRKAADMYARISVAKTGVIDTNKIHSYKYNDDIFRRMTTVSQGKNHGFVMFIDWSGSMIDNLNDTMKQLFSLVMFCKRIQIPFEVYLFRSSDTYEYGNNPVDMIKNRKKANIVFHDFKIRNILSSRMNAATLNKAFQLLWLLSNNIRFKCDRLDATPLNQTILAADYIINKFRKQNKVQIVNTIFLTDGGSDPITVRHENTNYEFGSFKRTSYFVRDHTTKKNYFVGSSMYGHTVTETFLKMLKERTDSNVIGFFITGSIRSVFNMLNIVDPDMRSNLQKSWNANNYVGIETNGYDEYYIINISKTNDVQSLNVNSDMTQRTVLKEFMKYSEKKTTNRVMLSKFIQRVAA